MATRKTRKFEGDKSYGLKGFWTPEKKGEAVEGVILDVGENEYGKWLVIELTDSCDVTSKDRDTGDKLTRTAKKGHAVGVTIWAGLRGLDRHKGFWTRIVFEGETREKGDNGDFVRTKNFDIDLSEQPEKGETKAKANGAGRRGRGKAEEAATDEDIPF